MRIFSLIFALLLMVSSCSVAVKSTSKPSNYPTDTKVILEGKWKEVSLNTKVFFDEDLKKIVLSNGCQVVSANYNRFEPAISFSNVTSTQKTCEVYGISLEDVIKQTVIIKSRSAKQIVLLNENQEELLILNKN